MSPDARTAARAHLDVLPDVLPDALPAALAASMAFTRLSISFVR